MLIDSNIFIYAIQPEYQDIRDWLQNNDISVSSITLLEVLGYYKLTQKDKNDFEKIFDLTQKIPISTQTVEQAIYLRQQKNMSLGDCIIAATALQHNKTLVTRNIKDFDWIENLKCLNPVKEKKVKA